MNKSMLFKRICELDFAIHELVLYLDTHPDCRKGLELLNKYRKIRNEAVESYEQNYGRLIITPADAGENGRWDWNDSPWPWEKDFMEA